MTVSRAYTHIGKFALKGTRGTQYEVWEGVYSFASGDTYSQTTRVTLTFAGMSNIKGILGIVGFSPGANLGNPVVPVSISGNVVTLMVLETGASGAGLAEKTEGETYGATTSLRCTVYGL